MSYRSEWAGALLEAQMQDMVTHGVRWIKEQPVGWARDGAMQRVNKVMQGWLERRMEVVLDETEYHPIDMLCGMTVKAKRAFERLAGRKPDCMSVDTWTETPQWDNSLHRDRYNIMVRVCFVCTERAVTTAREVPLSAQTGFPEDGGFVDTEWFEEEEFWLNADISYDRRIFEDA